MLNAGPIGAGAKPPVDAERGSKGGFDIVAQDGKADVPDRYPSRGLLALVWFVDRLPARAARGQPDAQSNRHRQLDVRRQPLALCRRPPRLGGQSNQGQWSRRRSPPIWTQRGCPNAERAPLISTTATAQTCTPRQALHRIGPPPETLAMRSERSRERGLKKDEHWPRTKHEDVLNKEPFSCESGT